MKALLVAFVLSLLAPTSYAQSDGVRLPPYTRLQLENGMTVLLMEHHEVPIVSLNLIVRAGATADPPGKEGLASVTAGLLRRGTRQRTAEQISADLDFIGAQFDMSAGVDFTTGSAEFLKKDLSHGLDLVADILRNPSFPSEEATKLTQQQVDGIRAAKDRVANVIGRYFNRYLFPDHAYGRPVGGTETSLPAIQRDDVVAFYNRHYSPSSVILAVAGDFSTPEIRNAIESRFGTWAGRPSPSTPIEAPRPANGKRVLLVDKPDATQTYFVLGNAGVSRTNPDRFAISVVNTLFGGRFTSRLNTALRVDSGLTYGANSQFDQRLLPGTFFISSFTRNEKTEEAIDMALKVLRTLNSDGVTDEELRSVKTYLKGQFPPTLETTDRLAATLARQEFYGLDDSDVNAYADQVEAVTAADAERVIRQYFQDQNLVFVLIGKVSEIGVIGKKYAEKVDMKTITEPGF